MYTHVCMWIYNLRSWSTNLGRWHTVRKGKKRWTGRELSTGKMSKSYITFLKETSMEPCPQPANICVWSQRPGLGIPGWSLWIHPYAFSLPYFLAVVMWNKHHHNHITHLGSFVATASKKSQILWKLTNDLFAFFLSNRTNQPKTHKIPWRPLNVVPPNFKAWGNYIPEKGNGLPWVTLLAEASLKPRSPNTQSRSLVTAPHVQPPRTTGLIYTATCELLQSLAGTPHHAMGVWICLWPHTLTSATPPDWLLCHTAQVSHC